MPRIQLSGGAYQSRSVIASAQACVNLFAEPLPEIQGEPSNFSYFPTPGLTLLGTAPASPFRGGITWEGNAYAVYGDHLYYLTLTTPGTIAGDITFHDQGTLSLSLGLTTPVGMEVSSATTPGVGGSQGTLMIVDGSVHGYALQLGFGIGGTLAPITDPNFAGATNVAYIDTYYVSNVPFGQAFQAGDSLALTWDPLYIAKKVSYADWLQTLVVAKREIWLLGTVSAEVWYNTGASDFPFQEMQGVFIDHGIIAKYSAAVIDNSVFWLSQDRRGQCLVLQGSGYQTKRVSTYALEAEMNGYSSVSGAEGYTYQFGGHQFYVLSFPGMARTWVYDLSTGQWHQWAAGTGGSLTRHRARKVWPCSFTGAEDNVLLAGDIGNGNLYRVDPKVFTDNGAPIQRIRAFPHILNDGNRQMYWQFIADMEVGNAPTGATDTNVSLGWSDDRGQTYGTPVTQSIGTNGQFLTSMQWQRLGMARDRVFRLSWTCPFETALQGCWLEVEKSEG